MKSKSDVAESESNGLGAATAGPSPQGVSGEFQNFIADVEDAGGAIVDKARDAAKTANGFVLEHPWQAVGIGAALGLLLGVALTRRK